MESVFVSLGSNLGDKVASIQEALDRIGSLPKTRVVRCSSFYQTTPIGVTQQPDFINAAAEIETEMEPLALMHAILEVEESMGRTRTVKWGPRRIDIDILIYNGLKLDTDVLALPHPRMCERAFVLAPLVEIAPDLLLPNGSRPAELLTGLADTQTITRLKGHE